MHTSQGQYFDVNAPRFKCCCGSIHVKTGAMVVAILMAIGVVGNLIRNIFAFGSENNASYLAYGIVGIVIGAVICISLFYGIRVERAAFLIPYLVIEFKNEPEMCAMMYENRNFAALFMGLTIIVLIIGAIISFIGFVSNVQFAHDFARSMGGTSYTDNYKTVSLYLFVYFLVVLAFQIWFFWVVYKCYVFFRLQFAFCQANGHTVGYSTQTTPGYGIQVTTVPGYYPQQQQQMAYAPQMTYAPQMNYTPQPPPAYAPQELEVGIQKQ